MAIAVYQEKVPTVEAVQFDGENADEVTTFVGKDYGKALGEKEYVLTPGGKDPRSGKVTVGAGQWIVKDARNPMTVLNDGDFCARYEITDKEPSAPHPEQPVPEEGEQPTEQPVE